jgi:hypothetical protein
MNSSTPVTQKTIPEVNLGAATASSRPVLAVRVFLSLLLMVDWLLLLDGRPD